MPKISVLMPLYNTNEKHLKEAVESILCQTFEDFEFLILNDSPDNREIEKVIKSYDDKRIKYHENVKNLGISLSRNRLIELAQGEYLAIMDHDDISLPTRFEKQVSVLDNNKNIGVVGCFDYLLHKKKNRKYPVSNLDIEASLFYKCSVLHPATMMRKSLLIDNNIRYQDKFSPAEDYSLYCDLLGKTEFYNIPEVLFHYRDHAKNTSNSNWTKMFDRISAVSAYVRIKEPEIWEKVQMKSISVTKYRLFGFIPFITIIKKPSKTKVSVFGVSFLSIRHNVYGDKII